MREGRGEHPFGDRGQLLCGVVFIVVWAADTFVLHWSTFLAARVPLAIRMVLLGVDLILALVLVGTAHGVVSGEKRPDHIVDTGPFHYVRHPLYLGTLLVYLGMAVSSLSLLSVALLVPIFLFYDYIARYEERQLEARFGDAYRSYESRTGKWIPGVRRLPTMGA